MKTTFRLLTAYCWSQRSAVIGAFRSSQFSIVPAGGFSLSGPLLYRYLFVVNFDRGHSCFRNFNSTIYVNFIRVKSSMTLRVYQWGSPSTINVTSFQIGFLHDWRNFPGYEMKTSSLDSYGLKQFSCRHCQNMHLRFYKRYGIFYAQNVIEYIECE